VEVIDSGILMLKPAPDDDCGRDVIADCGSSGSSADSSSDDSDDVEAALVACEVAVTLT
jgi:hypothetical protein